MKPEPPDPEDETTERFSAEDVNGSSVTFEAIKARHHYRERFITMFHSSLSQIASMDRPPTYYRVLFHLLAILDPIQFRFIASAQIASDLSLSAKSVERVMSMLKSDRVLIVKGKNSGQQKRLNNNICWGSTAKRHNLTDQDIEVLDSRGR